MKKRIKTRVTIITNLNCIINEKNEKCICVWVDCNNDV